MLAYKSYSVPTVVYGFRLRLYVHVRTLHTLTLHVTHRDSSSLLPSETPRLQVRERYDKHKELLAKDHRVSDTIETLATRALRRSDSHNQLLSRREGGSRSPVGTRHRKKASIERIKLLTPKGKFQPSY